MHAVLPFLGSSCQNSPPLKSTPSYCSTYTYEKVSNTGMRYLHRKLSGEEKAILSFLHNSIFVGVTSATLQVIKEVTAIHCGAAG